MAFEDLLEDPVIQKYLHELVGPKGMPVAAAPPDGEVTDEELAEELDMELNDVRRALFILYENDLASYRRLRDEDSGWLTYLWTFEYEKIPQNLKDEMYRMLNALEKRREYEMNHQFYLSEGAGLRFEFSEAMEYDFTCPQTGEPLQPHDNDHLVEAMDRRIEELRAELNVEPDREDAAAEA
jgi:transcription initiation factor TFIIE subunit alpha